MNDEIEMITEIKFQLESSNKINDELRCRIEKLEKKQEFNKNSRNDSRVKKIKKSTCELLEVSTSHGIPNIVKSKNLFILIVWSCFTITSTCLCSHFIIKTILDYLKYNTITSIKVIHENEAQFPTISFCAFPSFNTTLNETIISSRFDDVTETNINEFYEEFTDVLMGKCYRYNSGKNIYNMIFITLQLMVLLMVLNLKWI